MEMLREKVNIRDKQTGMGLCYLNKAPIAV